MAAFPQHHNGSIFGGSPGSINTLPSGSCNFRHLDAGSEALKCGCTRFWLNIQPSQSHAREWCFCGHHACFHDALGPLSNSRGLFDEPQRTIQSAPSNEAVDVAGTSTPYGVMRHPSMSRPEGLGIHRASQLQYAQTQPQSINTRVWEALNNFARDQEDGHQSGITSVLPSTRTPSVMGEPAYDPNTMPHISRPMPPPVEIPTNLLGAGLAIDQYSATEVATPSAAGTPDLRMANVVDPIYRDSPSNIRPSRFHPPAAGQPTHSPCPSGPGLPHPRPAETSRSGTNDIPPVDVMSVEQLRETVRSYGRRLEALENLSFSQVPVEELHEKFELFDGRILDLEHWRTDQDQRQEAVNSQDQDQPAERAEPRDGLLAEAKSFSSDASFDSNAAAYTEAAVLATLAANSETVPRIEALEERITGLENAVLPSYSRPWQLQVVVLPWGTGLKGIWFSSSESTQTSMKNSLSGDREWMPSTPALKTSFASSASGAWTTESIEAWADETHDWLSPKACGPTGTVFQRLASRGLVRDLTITSTDSYHIMSVIRSAFEGILRPESVTAADAGPYHALRESFIPLRKIRKSTRLRFLTPSEMVTPATWAASFLDSGVLMKVNDGLRRLYVTTPGAYQQSDSPSWTWKRLRELPIHDASGDEIAARAERAAIESCWCYNDRLDQAFSGRGSFASHTSTRSAHSASLNHFAAESAPITLPLQATNSSPGHNRTASLGSVDASIKAAVPKRRVASFETVSTAPLDAGEGPALAKKRRVTSSPEAERRGFGLTPRWSREPPSPYTAESNAEHRSEDTSGRRRGTTPFAYATPHSNNNNYLGHVDFRGGDGDTEADTDDANALEEDEQDDDEWQGMEDADSADDASASDEAEIDDLAIEEEGDNDSEMIDDMME